ncbi:MAG TPA: NYN domain-containing protein [Waterburya sp.]|jgi:hypothetical protein
MPDNASVTPAKDSAISHQISLCVYQAILEIQQQQPELLKEKYRTIPWHHARNQSNFLLKLRAGISTTNNEDVLLQRVQKVLQILLLPTYFESPSFHDLMERISVLTRPTDEFTPSVTETSAQQTVSSLSSASGQLASSTNGIAILLLDAENLQLDPNTEKFLAGICSYPIQIKVAFANWRSLGKQDVELHGRGYELIHVPAGKDSADVKMATVGSSIFVHYPTAKEVLVCSSDGVLTHLCTTLQTHGLTVYLVRRRGDIITVFNSKTHQAQTHSLKLIAEIPSIEEFINQLKGLIKAEQKRTNNQWIKLAKISSLFQETYKLSLSQVVSYHLPGKKPRDVFFNHPANFVVHQVSERDELYINCFEATSEKPLAEESKAQSNKSIEISSRPGLEQALIKIINASTNQSPDRYIPITMLGTVFRRQYGHSVTTVLKKLHLNAKLTKFLQSCSAFELKQTDKGWEVAVRIEA